MQPVRFIHAADLHLDAAFPGLARAVSPELARSLHEATFTALDRLTALCEEQNPDFLILAGDTWNQEDLSLRAQLALRDACERLGRRGIRVFLAHGNHDPFSSRLQALRWPDNVTVFGASVESVPVCRPGSDEEVIAVVHGISHGSSRETRNLASWFHRTDAPCPQIGVLHTTLNVGGSGEIPYAPCSPEDLATSGLDYWALGHIHGYGVVCREPLAVYSGSAQGLNINEQGPHGCVLVTLTPSLSSEAGFTGRAEGNAVGASQKFYPLAPVGWHILDINLQDELATISASSGDLGDLSEESDASSVAATFDLGRLERLIRDKIDAVAVWSGCETLVIRVRLTGRTPLDAELRRPSVRRELCDALREGHEGAAVNIWIKDMDVGTRPVLDRDVAAKREGLLGEVLRQADSWRADEALLARHTRDALGDLFSRGRSGRILNEPHGEDLAALLDEAERLCADLLENN